MKKWSTRREVLGLVCSSWLKIVRPMILISRWWSMMVVSKVWAETKAKTKWNNHPGWCRNKLALLANDISSWNLQRSNAICFGSPNIPKETNCLSNCSVSNVETTKTRRHVWNLLISDTDTAKKLLDGPEVGVCSTCSDMWHGITVYYHCFLWTIVNPPKKTWTSSTKITSHLARYCLVSLKVMGYNILQPKIQHKPPTPLKLVIQIRLAIDWTRIQSQLMAVFFI